MRTELLQVIDNLWGSSSLPCLGCNLSGAVSRDCQCRHKLHVWLSIKSVDMEGGVCGRTSRGASFHVLPIALERILL